MKTIAVVGASLAGMRTVEALRNGGFQGHLTLIGAENHLPYDRPPLSKAVLTTESGAESLSFVERSWFDEHDIELLLGRRATGLDLREHRVHLDAGSVTFDELVVATGARPRNPFQDTPSGVFTLRTIDDALALRAAFTRASNVVIVGGGFIGLEVASAAQTLGANVTVIELAQIPLSRNVGAEVALVLGDLARDHGITLKCGRSVTAFEGTDTITGVVLDDGTILPCDVAVVGVGAIPNTEWMGGAGLEITAAGLVCDATGRAAPHVWGAGDVAAWRDINGAVRRHEHWTSAGEQAQIVARNLLDAGDRTVNSASYVWSDQFGRRISIVGETTHHDSVRFLSRGGNDLAALYSRQGRFVGACIINQMRLVVQCRKWAATATNVNDIPEWDLATAQQTLNPIH